MSNDLRHLVVDYYFGLCDDNSHGQAQKAIDEDINCSRLYNGLTNTVGKLSSLDKDDCPDAVVTRMFEKIRNHSQSQKTLEGLLNNEIEFKRRRAYSIIGKFSRIAAVIAIVIGLGATYVPVTRQMRNISLRSACQNNLANIGIGLNHYAGDNAGMLPSVSAAGGSPWWQVGSQKEADHSNTRNLWLLVRNGYADINDFTCKARPDIADSRLKTINVCDYNRDFPSKDFVQYSFRIIGNKPVRIENLRMRPIGADSNPLFEESYMDKYTFFKTVVLNDNLRSANSINHGGTGQNVLLIDNSVSFNRVRMIENDDIYTIRDTDSYVGNEIPADNDIFLAP